MQYCQRRCQARVLHAHFDAQRRALRLLQAKHSAHGESDGETHQIVNHHYSHYQQSGSQQSVGIMSYDDAHHQRYHY